MSRNRRRPNFTPTATTSVDRDRLRVGDVTAASAAPEKPELLAVRHLTVEHVGRWIQINARPITLAEKDEPSVKTQVGRLVGIRTGDYGKDGLPLATPTRRVVLMQGTSIAEISLPVDQPVEVAPRSWS